VCIYERDLSGDVTTGTVRCDAGGLAIGAWLITDISFLDVRLTETVTSMSQEHDSEGVPAQSKKKKT
jgi:hypothetical protein